MFGLLAQTATLLTAVGGPAPFQPESAPARILAMTAPLEAATAHLSARLPEADQAVDDGPERKFRLGRAGLEIAGAMALGAAWYQSEIELNKVDFDFDRTWSDQSRRLFSTDGYRFDDNNRVLNVGHAFVGGYYHQFARKNGGGMAEAMAFDFITSSTWELFVEHREVFSLNDTIMTSLGAVPMGEPLFQLGDYFARSRPTVVNRVLMGLFSPAHATGLLWGERPAPSRAGYDDKGLARDAWRNFSLSTGGSRTVGDVANGPVPWQGDIRLDLELVNLPSYGHVASRKRRMRGGELTRVQADYVGTREDMRELSITSRTSMWGLHLQETTATEGGLRGHSTFVGSSTAFDLSIKDQGTFNDFVAALHLIGPAADVTLYRDRLSLRLATDVSPDFAMVRPYAMDPGAAAATLAGGQSTLHRHNYYYALGVATAARMEAGYRKLRAGAAVEWNHYDSIHGLDRHQKAYTSPTGRFHPAITDDLQASDQRLKLRVYGDGPVPLTPVRLGVSLDYGQRSGDLGAETRTAEDLRMSLLASFAL